MTNGRVCSDVASTACVNDAAPGRLRRSAGGGGDLNVTRDETADAPLRQCVIEQMSTLKLATPQRTGVDISYPIRFQPSN